MKARVKATGEIITIESDTMFIGKDYKGVVKPYYDSDIDIIKDEPDYWEKLKHQYAGMFFKSFLDKFDNTTSIEKLMDNSIKLAKIFINKLKEESQCEK